MKATEQHFPVVLFILLYRVIHIFEYVDETLKYDCYHAVQGGSYFWVCELTCNQSNGNYWAGRSCGAVIVYIVQRGSYFCVCGWNPKVWPFINEI